MSKSKFEHNTWYWVAHPHEGDIWWPVFIQDDIHCFMDGRLWPIEELESLRIKKAVMPEI